MDWGAIIGAAATIAAQQAQARAQAKQQEALAQHANDTVAQAGYATDKNANLQALAAAQNSQNARAGGILNEQELALAAPGRRAANSVRGSILANAQDAGVTGLPKGVPNIQFTGGLRPSMFSGDTRALGQQMTRDALLSQMAPQVTPYSDMKPLDVSSITSMKAPGPTPLPQASTLDSILANIGMYGGLAGVGLAAAQQQQRPPFTETRGGTTVPSLVE
jgi:hypothetical protein